MYSKLMTEGSTGHCSDEIRKLKKELQDRDVLVIGAGAGLSTSAGYVYSGERFRKYFGDLEKKYGYHDMYSGGFYPYRTPEERWGFWCRNIWINRYAPVPTDLYEQILELVKDKDYFVITTNVDHCFQRAGFDKQRLLYTQGDYGLFQSSKPEGITAQKTYDNRETVRKMILSEGFEIAEDGTLIVPEGRQISSVIPTELIPYCPDDGSEMAMNLRADDSFVEDEGWHQAAQRYTDFLHSHVHARTLFLEFGVGMNTPAIIKFPFWKMTAAWDDAFYACVNYSEAYVPEEIADRSVAISDDIGNVVRQLRESTL